MAKRDWRDTQKKLNLKTENWVMPVIKRERRKIKSEEDIKEVDGCKHDFILKAAVFTGTLPRQPKRQ